MSDPVRAWKPSIAEALLCPNLLYTGWTGVFLFKFPFPVRKLMSLGRIGYICIIRRDTPVSGDAMATLHVCQLKGRATGVGRPPPLDCV